MKNAILSAALAVTTFSAAAQNPYNLSVLTQAYTPLTTAPVNDTTAWLTGNFSAPLPFAFDLASQPLSRFNLMTANIGPATDTTGTVNGMVIMGAAFVDRGLMTGRSRSPIRFQTTGVAPSRIFKAEVSGAGFLEELMSNSTQEDSVNLQVWLYEGSHIVELRYGPSKVSANPDYFSDGGPTVGFVRGLDFSSASGGFQKLYGLTGSPSAPAVDSFDFSDPEQGLSAYPASGTVYRFTPRGFTPASVAAQSELALSAMYPNPFTDQLTFRYAGQGKVDYQVLALNGAKLIHGQAGYGEHHVNVSSLVPGAYVVRLSTADEVRSAQFIKR